MSNFYNKPYELLYAFYGAATVSVPTTSPGATITAGYPPIIIPANYFGDVGERSSSLVLKIGGLATTTATIPTWQFFLYAAIATTSAPAFATTNTIGSTATFTPGNALTNYVWNATIELGLRTLALGAASTVTAMGSFQSDIFGPSAFSTTQYELVTMPGPGAFTPFATYDTTQAYLLWPALSLGAATAGNTVTVEYCQLDGEN